MIKQLAFLFLAVLFTGFHSYGQETSFQTVKTHSHNDYQQAIPFFQAYEARMNSIEVDVFLHEGQLFAAHEQESIEAGKTFTQLYLVPLAERYKKNGQMPYPNNDQSLQFLIDIKGDYQDIIPQLVKELSRYDFMFNPAITKFPVEIVLSGNTPPAAKFTEYPAFIKIDGRSNVDYTKEQLDRIDMISDDIKDYAEWNGKGTPAVADMQKLKRVVDDAHALGKTFRFYGTSDGVNSWIELERLGVDWINTDQPKKVQEFLEKVSKTNYTQLSPKSTYTPNYQSDGKNKAPKNIILMIGDGMGLTQIQAGITANHGDLNILKFKHVGLSQTRASNSEITDSAAGATAMATGEKTNNRYVGTDSQGNAIPSLAVRLQEYGLKIGIISNGDITDATPAAFYAHQTERSWSDKIAADFLNSPVDILIGSGQKYFLENKTNPALIEQLKANGYALSTSLTQLKAAKGGKQLVLVNDDETRSILAGRGPFLQESLQQSVRILGNPKGFFMMIEGAQIDYGGHQENLPYVVTEMIDFDQAIGDALRIADQDGETLVIVTADHETGGLSLLSGDQSTGTVSGNFSTNDHTSVMVPVFAYGPGAQEFMGLYQNTEIFKKIISIKNQDR